ncbi:MAG: Glutamate racemase [Candidatus Anoxychlamydiales bacterium]|nr:Glutamate racemase [Candidatus Anoxychlamydiales bacterium]
MQKNNLSKKSIGIFDSGIGGLSVYHEIIKLLPFENTLYLADNAKMPYGNKSETLIKNLSFNSSNFLIKKNVKAIVIACNSISSLAKDFLKSKFSIPIIDMIDPIVNYINKKSLKKILILSTFATANTKVFEKKLINKNITTLPSSFLACLIEDKSKFINEYLDEFLKSVKDKKFDAILLACTHYCLIKDLIQKKFSNDIKIIDPSFLIAKELKTILENNNLLNSQKNIGNKYFFVSENKRMFKDSANSFLKIQIENLKKKSCF